MSLSLTKVSVGPMDNNAYLLRCTDTGDQVLIDAANEADRLLSLVDGNLATVITTHRHADHWQALAEVVAATGARAVAHPDDSVSLHYLALSDIYQVPIVDVTRCSTYADRRHRWLFDVFRRAEYTGKTCGRL